jgi:hypothetical protein
MDSIGAATYSIAGYADDGTTVWTRLEVPRTGNPILRWSTTAEMDMPAEFQIETKGPKWTTLSQVCQVGSGHYHNFHIGDSSNATRKFVIQVQDSGYNLFACDDTGNPFADRKGFGIARSDGRMTLGRATVPTDLALTVATKDYADGVNATHTIRGGTFIMNEPIQSVTLTPPTGMKLISVVPSIDGGTIYWLNTNGRMSFILGAEIMDGALGTCNFVRREVSPGSASEASLQLKIHWIAYYGKV